MISLEQARDAAPRHGSVREALGRAYYGAGRTAAAGAEFSEALQIDPSNDFAHFGLGLCLARGGQRARALGHLRLAVAMRPEVDTYRQALDRVKGREAGQGADLGTGIAADASGPGSRGRNGHGGGTASGNPTGPGDWGGSGDRAGGEPEGRDRPGGRG